MTWFVPTSIPLLLSRVLHALAGGAVLSLQGEIKSYNFSAFSSSKISSDIMKPLDDSPTSIFLLLPLEKHTVNVIVDTLTHDPWLCDRVTHLRIEKAGRLVFNAGDNFHPECISIDEETNKDLLDAMVGEGLIHIA